MSENNQNFNGKRADPRTGQAAACDNDFITRLKREAAESQLPADVKEEILAKLPCEAERERLYREMQINGGLTSKEFMESLGLEAGSQP